MSYNPYNQGPGAEAGYGYSQPTVSYPPDCAGCSRIHAIDSVAGSMRRSLPLDCD
jgi:hypothetical protein